MGGFSGLLLDHSSEVGLSLKVSCLVQLGLGLGVCEGSLLCRWCICLLLGGDAEGNHVPFLLEDFFASLGVGQPDGLGSSRGTLGIGCGLELGDLVSFRQLPGMLGIEGLLGRGEACSVSGRGQPLFLSLLRSGSLCGGLQLSLLDAVGLLGEALLPIGTLFT